MGNAIDNLRHLIDSYGWRDNRDMQDFIDAADMIDMQYVELPKDADGLPIHVGDVMDGIDKYDSFKEVTGKVITVSFEEDGIVDVAVQAWNSDGKSWHRAYLDPYASVYRHHHEPTVEDVLTEFGIDWEHESDCEDRAALLKEYATRLQLAGDAAGPNELAMAYHVGYDDALAKRRPNANKVMRK